MVRLGLLNLKNTQWAYLRPNLIENERDKSRKHISMMIHYLHLIEAVALLLAQTASRFHNHS